MAQVSMQQVKELRDRTQAGLNDCKSALVEADGDMDKAVEIILKKGLAKSAKRAGAVATEGEVATRIAADGKSCVIAEINIQTDFAARNAEFKAFVGKVLDAAEAAKPGTDLLSQAYPGGQGTVEENRQALVGKLGENVTVRRWAKLAVDGAGLVHSYVHMGGKVGVVLAVACDAGAESKPEILKLADDVAMQAAAMAPLYLVSSEIPADAVAKQTDIFNAQLEDEKKPEAARPKIIEGKLAKWRKEVCLLEQVSVIESEKSVAQLVAETAKAVGCKVVIQGFIRYERGEGIEKPKGKDFATEVAEMSKA